MADLNPPTDIAPAASTAPRVFISYSHDSREHQDRVLAFANRLREWGIDAAVDQFVHSPREGWPMWTERNIRQSDFVLVVCTETYLTRVERREQPGRGRGVLWESVLMYNELYFTDAAAAKFIPVMFEDLPGVVPAPLRGVTYYQIALQSDYEELYRRLTNQPRHAEPTLTRRPALAAIAAQSYPASPAASPEIRPATDLELRNRHRLLKRVRQDWIRGVLEQSLDQGVRLELGLASRPTAVERFLNARVQVADRPSAALTSDIAAVFEDSGEALLILGAPGAGKTTLLLALARHLLDQSEIDPDLSLIPAVFNLSSWALRRRPLGRWLADELHLLYDVPRSLARRWVETERILPLLDGLDEVAADCREACVEAVNAFRQDYGLLPIAVCSRLADYEALGRKLRLSHAIVVQPLTNQQVQAHLETAGSPALQLLATMNDGSLREFLQTPLMLSVATLALRDLPPSALPTERPEQFQRELLSRFVQAMFRRRAPMARYGETQAIRWLTWLATAWVRNGITVFYLEYLGPRWVPGGRSVAKLGIGAITGLIFWLGFGLAFGGVQGLDSALFFAGDEGAMALLDETLQQLADDVPDVWLSGDGVMIGVVFGVLGGLVDFRPVSLGLRGIGLRVRGAARSALISGLLWGGVLGLILALSEGLNAGGVAGWRAGLEEVFGVWLISLPIFGLIAAVVGGASKLFAVDPAETGKAANEGTYRSIVAAVCMWFVITPMAGVLLELGIDVDPDHLARMPRMPDLGDVLAGGWPIGLFAAAFFGGLFAVKHYACRAILWMNNKAPWNYVRFLDSAADRLFLRRVGGGYMFVHRIVLEHFASLGGNDPWDGGVHVAGTDNGPRG